MFRTTRAPAAFAALLGLVLGLLVGGVQGEWTVSAGPAVGAVVSAFAGSVASVVSAPVGPVASASAGSSGSAPGAGVPGCDPGRSVVAGADGPVVPPRAHGFAELLPALAADRAAGGVRCAVADGPEPAPGREPPDLVPPSPVELSVLRV